MVMEEIESAMVEPDHCTQRRMAVAAPLLGQRLFLRRVGVLALDQNHKQDLVFTFTL